MLHLIALLTLMPQVFALEIVRPLYKEKKDNPLNVKNSHVRVVRCEVVLQDALSDHYAFMADLFWEE